MNDLAKRTLASLLTLPLVLAALIFSPALSLNYWQGWLYWSVMLAAVFAIMAYCLTYTPALIERRRKSGPFAEREPRQKLIQSINSVAILLVFIVSGLDHAFGWSRVPSPLVVAADALVLAGFAIVFLVFRENAFASSIVEVMEGQRVIDTGPYARVRHPMYAGTELVIFATPVALGSWWGLLPALVLAGAIVWRLLDEEEFLARNLSGYENYREKVRFRLVPLVW